MGGVADDDREFDSDFPRRSDARNPLGVLVLCPLRAMVCTCCPPFSFSFTFTYPTSPSRTWSHPRVREREPLRCERVRPLAINELELKSALVAA